MPCDTVKTVQVEIGKLDFPRLEKALKTDGWRVTVGQTTLRAYKDGVSVTLQKSQTAASITGYAGNPDDLLAAIKRSYAAQTIKDAAKRFRMSVVSETRTGDTIKMKVRS